GQHDYGPADRTFAGNPLSQDPDRFGIMERYFRAFPDMTVGGVTWGWLSAAMRSMREVRHFPYLGRITLPILTLTGSLDRVTPARELERYLACLPGADNIVVPGALHDVMNETDACRAAAWWYIDRFMTRVMTA
nr:alpha/beta hydrolase [Pseudomonadota bacterium]